MRGWYLTKSGATDEGEAVFRQLLAERPDDADVRITLGHAPFGRRPPGLCAGGVRRRAGRREAARGFSKEIDRVRVERRAEREHVGLELDEDDLLAPAPDLRARVLIAWAVAWFPPDQHAGRARALARSGRRPHRPGGLFAAHRGTASNPQRRPRAAARPSRRSSSTTSSPGPTEEGYDPAGADARSTYAAELNRTGRAIPWPPAATTHAGAGRVASTSAAAAPSETDDQCAVRRRSKPASDSSRTSCQPSVFGVTPHSAIRCQSTSSSGTRAVGMRQAGPGRLAGSRRLPDAVSTNSALTWRCASG